MQEKLLQEYARFLVKSGSNVQPGQNFIINAPIEAAYFARLCAEEAYAAGGREVVVQYVDEEFSRIRMQHTDVDVLQQCKPWLLQRYMEYTTDAGGLAMLRISADNPEIFKGLDTDKISKASAANRKAMRPFQDLTMANKVQWSIGAIPSSAWSQKVFPGLDAAEAQEKLWQAIFDVCRIRVGEDPVQSWQKHLADIQAHLEQLNKLNLQSIHMSSANGTNLTVGLADKHVWKGGGDVSTAGVPMLPNIPTEEVFTAPHCRRVHGVVKSSMPYVYNGNLITGISVRFEDGVAVEYAAEQGNDLLHQMLGVDEAAKRIGEIALVPASSPIRKSGLLFYNTLFDENAACHIAFGAGYPGTVENGDSLSREELLALGVNDSLIHEDVMVGTQDMDITGLTKAGETVQIFTNGEWAF